MKKRKMARKHLKKLLLKNRKNLTRTERWLIEILIFQLQKHPEQIIKRFMQKIVELLILTMPKF